LSTEETWPVPQRPMQLLDIYRSTGRLAVRTALRSLPIALALLVPLAMMLGAAFRTLLREFARILADHGGSEAELSQEAATQLMMSIGGATVTFAGTAILVFIASNVVQLVVTSESWDHTVGEQRTLREWLRRTFGRPVAMTLAQAVLLMVLLFAISLVASFFLAAFSAAGDVAGTIGAFVISAVIVYLFIGTIFRLHEIVADDRGAWRSLISSFALARGHWWKILLTLLPLILLYLVCGELISPATTQLQDDALSARAESFRELARGYGPGRWAALGALWAAFHFLGVNLLTALYVDLRARRGDFDFDEEGEWRMEDGG
jgi:hypothetical protein